MSLSIPRAFKKWTVEGTDGFDSLKLTKSASLEQAGNYECVVRFHAASLNYRDLVIPQGRYPFPNKSGVVPGSDGAGEVVAVGPKVTRFRPGAKACLLSIHEHSVGGLEGGVGRLANAASNQVITLFNQAHLSGPVNVRSLQTGVGGLVDGTLAEYGIFNENGLVEMPASLNWLEGATLSCAALTAWNALYGVKPLRPGDVVLTQGTGGVSIFAVQFAKAAGATVIATTSSTEKAEVLKELGADHVINYNEIPNWGEKAKELTPNQEGVSHVLEVGGPTTIAQSLHAIKFEGVISIIGFLGGSTDHQPSFSDALLNIAIVRGVYVGNRDQLEDMILAIEANKIKPVLDKKVFALEEVKEAYEYMWQQKHVGKVCIKID